MQLCIVLCAAVVFDSVVCCHKVKGSLSEEKCKANAQRQTNLKKSVFSCSQLSRRGHVSFLKCSSEQTRAVSHELRQHHQNIRETISDASLFSDDFTATPRYYANVRHILCNYKRTPLRKMRRVALPGLIIQSWLLSHLSKSRREQAIGSGWPCRNRSCVWLEHQSRCELENKQLAHVSWKEMRRLPLL